MADSIAPIEIEKTLNEDKPIDDKPTELEQAEVITPMKNSISYLIKSHFALFNLGLTFLFSIALIYLVAVSPYCYSETICKLDFSTISYAMLTFFCAGGLGGAVCNLRGFFEYYTDKGSLPDTLFVPYCVRPWMGAGSGLIAFFVLSFLNTALSNANSLAWTTFSGRIPYIGLALLAGFGSREFMDRLKETAKAAFSGSSQEQSEVSANTMATWGADGAGPENLQVNKDEIVLLAGDIEKTDEFKWRIFREGDPIPKPAGKSTAISFSGGSDEDRRAKAREQARLRAEEEGISDWETLEIQ
ncbi:MAG: hypothetical protein ACP5OU_08690 [Methanothrix sp.]